MINAPVVMIVVCRYVSRLVCVLEFWITLSSSPFVLMYTQILFYIRLTFVLIKGKHSSKETFLPLVSVLGMLECMIGSHSIFALSLSAILRMVSGSCPLRTAGKSMAKLGWKYIVILVSFLIWIDVVFDRKISAPDYHICLRGSLVSLVGTCR